MVALVVVILCHCSGIYTGMWSAVAEGGAGSAWVGLGCLSFGIGLACHKHVMKYVMDGPL